MLGRSSEKITHWSILNRLNGEFGVRKDLRAPSIHFVSIAIILAPFQIYTQNIN